MQTIIGQMGLIYRLVPQCTFILEGPLGTNKVCFYCIVFEFETLDFIGSLAVLYRVYHSFIFLSETGVMQ